jgi:hypothetical protein
VAENRISSFFPSALSQKIRVHPRPSVVKSVFRALCFPLPAKNPRPSVPNLWQKTEFRAFSSRLSLKTSVCIGPHLWQKTEFPAFSFRLSLKISAYIRANPWSKTEFLLLRCSEVPARRGSNVLLLYPLAQRPHLWRINSSALFVFRFHSQTIRVHPCPSVVKSALPLTRIKICAHRSQSVAKKSVAKKSLLDIKQISCPEPRRRAPKPPSTTNV